jgi:DNA-binding transcriptional ArsR family regulator
MPKRNGTGIALLADPTRRRIIALCAGRSRRPSTVAKLLGVSRPTATRQLLLLADAGLLARRKALGDGRGVRYIVEPARIGQIMAWLAGTEVGWDGSDGEPPYVGMTSPDEPPSARPSAPSSGRPSK